MNTPHVTKTFCLHEFRDVQSLHDLNHLLAALGPIITEEVAHALGKEAVEIKYINILDADPESPDYNPDGMIGKFVAEPNPGAESGLSFGEALEALKCGRRACREGWNGKGMFLFLLPAADGIPTRVIHDPALRAVIESEVGGETFDALGSIRMFTADRKILTGWLASQTDMLANDWRVLPS